MMKPIVKILPLIIAISLIMPGCNGAKKSSQETSTIKQEQPTATQTTTGPQNQMPIIKDGSVTLTLACPDNRYAAASLNQNLPVWQEVEKVTGIKIKWDVVPFEQYGTTIQTRMAAAMNLPDIILSAFDTYKYGKDGVIIPLDDYLKKYGENAEKVFKLKPLLPALMKTPEGVTYQLSGVLDEEVASGPYGWLIRKDWLDKLGLKEPVTTDDWYTVLKAFKEKDPNNNGKQDEIPLTNYGYIGVTTKWGNAWGLHLYNSEGFYPDKDGKIQYEWLDPRAKEMVAFLNKLTKEGLYDLEFATNTKDQIISKITRGLSGAVQAYQEATALYNNKLKEAGDTSANWVMTMPPAGPNGYKGHIETTGILNGAFTISKDCKKPDIAFRWLDYVVYNEENARRQTLGIEGKSYTMVNGEPQLTDFVLKNPDNLGPVDAIRSLGAWQEISLYYKSEYVTKLKVTNEEMAKRTKAVLPYIVPKQDFPMATAEEFEKINKKFTDIRTYRDEMATKFILGQEPLDKWDSFVQTLKDMGIDDVIAVKQAQYERLKKMQ